MLSLDFPLSGAIWLAQDCYWIFMVSRQYLACVCVCIYIYTSNPKASMYGFTVQGLRDSRGNLVGSCPMSHASGPHSISGSFRFGGFVLSPQKDPNNRV